jgi:hypothetical protein
MFTNINLLLFFSKKQSIHGNRGLSLFTEKKYIYVRLHVNKTLVKSIKKKKV